MTRSPTNSARSSKNCVNCGSPLPDSHQHRTCSMCYGDLDYGTDGYYRRYMEQAEEAEARRVQERAQQAMDAFDGSHD